MKDIKNLLGEAVTLNRKNGLSLVEFFLHVKKIRLDPLTRQKISSAIFFELSKIKNFDEDENLLHFYLSSAKNFSNQDIFSDLFYSWLSNYESRKLAPELELELFEAAAVNQSDSKLGKFWLNNLHAYYEPKFRAVLYKGAAFCPSDQSITRPNEDLLSIFLPKYFAGLRSDRDFKKKVREGLSIIESYYGPSPLWSIMWLEMAATQKWPIWLVNAFDLFVITTSNSSKMVIYLRNCYERFIRSKYANTKIKASHASFFQLILDQGFTEEIYQILENMEISFFRCPYEIDNNVVAQQIFYTELSSGRFSDLPQSLINSFRNNLFNQSEVVSG